MNVRLTQPELVGRRPDGQDGSPGRHITTWQGRFDGTPDAWWLEAFAMWAGEVLQGVCELKVTTDGYEFECREDRIDEVIEKLFKAATRAGPTGERHKSRDRKHVETRRLFARVDAIKREMLAQAGDAERATELCELKERMLKKFKSLEEQ